MHKYIEINGFIYLTIIISDKAPLVLLDTFNAYVKNEIGPTEVNASARRMRFKRGYIRKPYVFTLAPFCGVSTQQFSKNKHYPLDATQVDYYEDCIRATPHISTSIKPVRKRSSG